MGLKEKKEICESELTIPADSFLYTNEYRNFVNYKLISHYVGDCIKSNSQLSDKMEKAFVVSNPEQFEVYSLLGDYYFKNKNYASATENYNIALSKEIPLQKEVKHIKEQLKKCAEQKVNS